MSLQSSELEEHIFCERMTHHHMERAITPNFTHDENAIMRSVTHTINQTYRNYRSWTHAIFGKKQQK